VRCSACCSVSFLYLGGSDSTEGGLQCVAVSFAVCVALCLSVCLAVCVAVHFFHIQAGATAQKQVQPIASAVSFLQSPNLNR